MCRSWKEPVKSARSPWLRQGASRPLPTCLPQCQPPPQPQILRPPASTCSLNSCGGTTEGGRTCVNVAVVYIGLSPQGHFTACGEGNETLLKMLQRSDHLFLFLICSRRSFSVTPLSRFDVALDALPRTVSGPNVFVHVVQTWRVGGTSRLFLLLLVCFVTHNFLYFVSSPETRKRGKRRRGN